MKRPSSREGESSTPDDRIGDAGGRGSAQAERVELTAATAGVPEELYVMQAHLLRIAASPHRLQIIEALAGDAGNVARLVERLGLSQPAVSQHLAVLKNAGLVESTRAGREVRYQLAASVDT